MFAIARSEFTKLRTLRSTMLVSFFVILFPVVGTLSAAAFKHKPNSEMVANILAGVGVVSALLCGVLGVFAIAQEYSQGTIRITFAASPRRMKVFVAKCLVVAMWITTCVVLIALLGLGGANVILKSRDIPVGVMLDGTTWQLLYALCAVCVLFGLVGFALGSILRSSSGAIATLILVPLLVEGILALILYEAADIDISRWTPFTAAFRSLAVTADVGRLGLVGYFGAWSAGLIGVAALFVRRRDA